MSEIITHATEADYGGKMCKCYVCGIVRRCTEDFDFYRAADDLKKGGPTPLKCEKCLLKKEFGENIPPIITIDHDDNDQAEELN